MIVLEFSTFFGRFHPLFVHMPIGILFLAVALEWYEIFKKSKTRSELIPIAWFLGGLSAAAAAFSGWKLGATGLYEENLLFSHRWLGIALVFVAFVGWWVKSKFEQYANWVQHGINFILLGMLFVEGHKGGNLTHGETFLTEHAPESIKNLFLGDNSTDSIAQFTNPDSVRVYADLIQPIFKSKCIACHNHVIKRGGLNMSHPDSLRLGGDSEDLLVAGNSEKSELFRRISLPQNNIKFMPPTSDVLTYDEIKMVEWWIGQGPSFDGTVTSMKITDDIKPVLLRHYGLDTDPKPWYETVQLKPLDSLQVTGLQKKGFTVTTLGAENPLLDVKYSGNDLNKDQIAELEKIKDHITWLSLAGTNVHDEWLTIVGNLPNLTRLQLEKTSISDKGVARLLDLEHLETLNLYGTNVTDACLIDIQKIESLKRVYLWGTKVNNEIANNLEEKNMGLHIIID
ncbi:hypothetical protein B4Q04_00365 [Zobellia sp. OII3]|uniref:c-type cytochrome domain-containing protein n=1 Tax=Zobellia sp. OII3 TaxID=2034520 RepID=UPI000B52DC3B|nr:c-type cytochrome domain-containing protein [Zobellia sp. OII3]OWW26172.1 hypothetical protein B4Q04_00365 [Zobellia sp. OII3]